MKTFGSVMTEAARRKGIPQAGIDLMLVELGQTALMPLKMESKATFEDLVQRTMTAIDSMADELRKNPDFLKSIEDEVQRWNRMN